MINQSQSNVWPIVFAIVAALVAGGGVYYWQNSQENLPVEISEETTEETSEKVTAEVVEEVAEITTENKSEVEEPVRDYNWSNYNVAFNYPNGWNTYKNKCFDGGIEADGLVITKSVITGDTGGGFEIEFCAVKSFSLAEYVASLRDVDGFEDVGQVRFGQNTFRVIYYNVFDLRRPHYLLESNGVLYVILMRDELLAEMVLETFVLL